MPPWQPLRKDFVADGTPCHRGCRLRSGTAIIMRDTATEKEHAFGPDCASNALGHPVGPIPDLTRGQIAGTQGGGNGVGGVGGKNSGINREQRALEYLILRADRLAHIPNLRFHVLDQAYAEYKATGVVQTPIVESIMNKCRANDLSAENVQNVYAYDAALKLLETALANTEKANFLASLRADLHRRLRLTKGQCEAVNRFLIRERRNWRLRVPKGWLSKEAAAPVKSSTEPAS